MTEEEKINLLTLLQTLNEHINQLTETVKTFNLDFKTEMQNITKTLQTLQTELTGIKTELAKVPAPPEVTPPVPWPTRSPTREGTAAE